MDSCLRKTPFVTRATLTIGLRRDDDEDWGHHDTWRLGLAWLLVAMGDPTDGSFPVFYMPISSLLLGLMLIAGMAFVAGILPALQAQRLQIADALRR